MEKSNEIMLLVAFYWILIIIASIVILAPVSPMIGPLILEIGGAVGCLTIMWVENKKKPSIFS
jgi:uncharacterized membrane-anchored protein